jgi:hypothetical protein
MLWSTKNGQRDSRADRLQQKWSIAFILRIHIEFPEKIQLRVTTDAKDRSLKVPLIVSLSALPLRGSWDIISRSTFPLKISAGFMRVMHLQRG